MKNYGFYVTLFIGFYLGYLACAVVSGLCESTVYWLRNRKKRRPW